MNIELIRNALYKVSCVARVHPVEIGRADLYSTDHLQLNAHTRVPRETGASHTRENFQRLASARGVARESFTQA